VVDENAPAHQNAHRESRLERFSEFALEAAVIGFAPLIAGFLHVNLDSGYFVASIVVLIALGALVLRKARRARRLKRPSELQAGQ
jgi:O-antigen/teichoic acid export membrane protein